MKSFRILEHRADLKIEANGKSEEEVFINMALAMQDFLKIEPEEDLTKPINKKISIKSIDKESLLIDFLNEINFYIEAEKIFFTNFEFEKLLENELSADLKGFNYKSIAKNIKAATYHDTKIFQENENWKAIVLFDI
jgi:SHS2 domain-containing protein